MKLHNRDLSRAIHEPGAILGAVWTSRGGGPINEALLALPNSTVTEQGEEIAESTVTLESQSTT